jgi:spore maturation protein CgeB
LVVSPGSNYSTTDVYDGLVSGFRSLGHEVVEYDTLKRIHLSDAWLRWILPKADESIKIPPKPRPDGKPEDYKGFGEYNDALRYNALKDVLIEARRTAADLLIVVSGYVFSKELLSMLSKRPDTPHGAGVVPTVMLFTESPYEEQRQLERARLVDAVFVNDKASLDLYWKAVPYSWYLPMAYHHDKHHPAPVGPYGDYKHDVVFVGVGYDERIALLEGVDWSGINLGLYGDWRGVEGDSPLKPFVHQGIIENSEAIELYQSSRVGLNLYRNCVDYWGDGGATADGGQSLNPRAYELAACGVPQVSEYRGEWDDVFGDDVFGVTFTDSGGLENSVRALLRLPEFREQVAQHQRSAVKGHSYRDRAAFIVECLTGG